MNKSRRLVSVAVLALHAAGCGDSSSQAPPQDGGSVSEGAAGSDAAGDPEGGFSDAGAEAGLEAGPEAALDTGVDVESGEDALPDAGEDAVSEAGAEAGSCSTDPYAGSSCEWVIGIPISSSMITMTNDTRCGTNNFPGVVACGGATPFDGPELYYGAGGFLTFGCTFVPAFDAELYILSSGGCASGALAEEQCSTGDHWHVPAGQSQGFGWSYGGAYVIVVDSIGPGGPFTLQCTGTQDPDIP